MYVISVQDNTVGGVGIQGASLGISDPSIFDIPDICKSELIDDRPLQPHVRSIMKCFCAYIDSDWILIFFNIKNKSCHKWENKLSQIAFILRYSFVLFICRSVIV